MNFLMSLKEVHSFANHWKHTCRRYRNYTFEPGPPAALLPGRHYIELDVNEKATEEEIQAYSGCSDVFRILEQPGVNSRRVVLQFISEEDARAVLELTETKKVQREVIGSFFLEIANRN